MTTIIHYSVAARINSRTSEVKRKSFTDAEKAVRYYNQLKNIFAHVAMYGVTDEYETEILMSTDAVAVA